MLSPEQQRIQLRERILRRFEVWLDEALNPEAIPQGLAVEILDQLEAEDSLAAATAQGDEDLQAVCAALVGLTDANQQQREALQKLHDSMPAVQGLTDAVSTLLKTLATEREQEKQKREKREQERDKQQQEQRVQARREIFKEVLDTVIDMHDRLSDQLAMALTDVSSTPDLAPVPKRRWWQRRAQTTPGPDNAEMRVAVERLVKGCQLAIQRLDESLARWHVHPIDCIGQPFDAERMKAVDREERADAADGTVLQVIRNGYTWNKTLFRSAEVKIAQNANPMDESVSE
jgi:molecular chaperone GrpE